MSEVKYLLFVYLCNNTGTTPLHVCVLYFMHGNGKLMLSLPAELSRTCS